MLPIAVGLVLVAALAVIGYFYVSGGGTAVANPARAGITCDTAEHVRGGDHHYHAHLTILYQGTELNVPGQIGIPADGTCIYWLHTHDTSGVIHIEAPATRDHGFTLGQFFSVWGKPISKTQVAQIKLGKDDKLVMYVDGKPYTGDPASIKLGAHTQIVLEITPPEVTPPPTYTFDPNL